MAKSLKSSSSATNATHNIQLKMTAMFGGLTMEETLRHVKNRTSQKFKYQIEEKKEPDSDGFNFDED